MQTQKRDIFVLQVWLIVHVQCFSLDYRILFNRGHSIVLVEQMKTKHLLSVKHDHLLSSFIQTQLHVLAK